LENRKVISGREASQILNTPWNKVKKLIENGELQGNIQTIKKHSRIFVTRESIENYLKSQSELMFLKEVKEFLGVSYKSVNILISNSILNPISNQRSKKYIQVARAEVEELFNLLTFSLSERDQYQLVKTSFILSKLSVNGLNISDYFSLVKKKYLVPRQKVAGNGIYQFLYDKKEVYAALLKYKLDNRKRLLNSIDVSNILKLDNSLILSWIKRGFITGDYTNKDIQKFSMQDIRKFISKYITLKEIQCMYLKNYKKIIKKMSELGVSPVSGEKVDGSKGYLFLRHDFIKIQKQLENLLDI
jgi:hypothetical protein